MKTQQALLGCALALFATMAWGTLPLAVQHVLTRMDAATLVWFRFTAAALGLLLILGLGGRLPPRRAFHRSLGKWLLLGTCGLAGNFFLFSSSLHYIPPTTLQILWQLAPFTMMLCGVLIFKEPFGRHQKIGLILLFVGLAAFFNDRIGDILQGGRYAFGVLLGAGAACVWVLYGISQKRLLSAFTSQQILLLIYTGCALVLLPAAAPVQLARLDSAWVLGCFVYCCLNTLAAYGAYAESLKHWDAAKVSVITTLLPVFTLSFSWLAYWWLPDLFEQPQMNALSYAGAAVVVCGTVISSAGHRLPLFRRAT